MLVTCKVKLASDFPCPGDHLTEFASLYYQEYIFYRNFSIINVNKLVIKWVKQHFSCFHTVFIIKKYISKLFNVVFYYTEVKKH